LIRQIVISNDVLTTIAVTVSSGSTNEIGTTAIFFGTAYLTTD
jgi:hypothetical protein